MAKHFLHATRAKHFLHATRPGIARLRVGALYTLQGCETEAGLNHYQLTLARKAGVVRAIRCGDRLYYRGAELIEWLHRDTSRW